MRTEARLLNATERNPTLRIGTGGTEVEFLSDPYVVYTRRGYAPVVDVRVADVGSERTLFVSAVSLASALEEIRLGRGDARGGQEPGYPNRAPSNTVRTL